MAAHGVRRISKQLTSRRSFSNPIRIIGFNTAERWSEDVSEDIAHEMQRRCDLQQIEVPASLEAFVDRHTGGRQQLTLRLV
ncbi:hypothetical protein [Bradyrhizobium septentrionale]|uniref:Uncharacterized protein n=1 Tax=Bradyrhizobium septentrionale TaxID=1404411 RepID=A0ABZ2NPB6_9BRAD